MAKHHIIISGTGRAGTTFLIQLLTALGLETGFTDLTAAVDANCHAGMEWDLRHADAPYVIKSPWLCDYLDEVLERTEIVIDHAIIPVRELSAAAESRRDVTRRTPPALYAGAIPGGLWYTDDPQQQETVLATQLYKIIYTVAKRDIPLTLLYFPRLIHDPAYLYGKLEALVPGMSYEGFRNVFQQVVHPEFVHEFRHAPEGWRLVRHLLRRLLGRSLQGPAGGNV
jgi:hypothetical protein